VITGYGAVARTARVEPGSTVAVFGAGGIGLSTINAAAIAGAGRIICIDKDPFKFDLAKAFGATDIVDANLGDTVKRIRDLTNGGVHYAFECIGLKATAEQSFSCLRPGGAATIIGMIPVGTKIELHGVDFLAERKIQGSMMGSNQFRTDMPRLIDFYLQGKTAPDALAHSLEGSSLETIRYMVASGAGVAVMPSTAADPLIDREPMVKVLSFAGSQPARTVGLVWRVTFPRPQAIDAVRAAILSCQLPGATAVR
jgi:Zn-dependent alcohol dehydrogenase